MREYVPIPEMYVTIRTNARLYGIIPTQEEREALASNAREGCQQARETLLRALYRYSEKKAFRYNEMFFHQSGSCFEDIYQEGIASGVAALDRALNKYVDPMPYLFRTIANEMIEFCLYRNHLIRIPETRHKTVEADDKRGFTTDPPYPLAYIGSFTEEELDTLFPEEYRPREHDTLMQQRLYDAVDNLRGRYKTVIEMRYGLNGHPETGLQPISLHISGGKTKSMAGSYQSLALRQLRGALAQEGIH